MPKLNLTVKKLDDVEEPLRALYVERDGKFELDVDGVPEMRSALKTANEEAKALRLKYKGIDPEEVETLRTTVADLQSKTGTEAMEAVKTQLLTAHGKEKEKLQKKLDRLTGELERAMIDTTATAEILTAKGAPILLLPHVKKFTKMVEGDDGQYQVQVVDSKGNPRVRDDGSPMTITHFVEELKADAQYGRAFDGKGSTGSGMGGGGGGGGAAGLKRSKMTVPEKSKYIEDHGSEAYLKLPA